jgi:hypothetical protein
MTTNKQSRDISGRAMHTVFTMSSYGLLTAQLIRILYVERLIKWAHTMANLADKDWKETLAQISQAPAAL